MFRDYAERGRVFKQEVARLAERVEIDTRALSSHQPGCGGEELAAGNAGCPGLRGWCLPPGRLMTADCSRASAPAHIQEPTPVSARYSRTLVRPAGPDSSMARKLKSDKFLFTATLLLVCASVVMVYSASAVLAHGPVSPAVPVPVQAGDVGAARPGADADRDAHRLSPLPAAGGASGRRWGCGARAGRGAVRSAHQRRDAAGSASAGIGVQPSELAKIAVIFFIAALLERRMDRIDEVRLLAAADRLVARPRGRR